MKRTSAVALATAAMWLGGLMVPVTAQADQPTDTSNAVCGYTGAEYKHVVHHGAVIGVEFEMTRAVEFEETRYVQVVHYDATYEDVIYVEWQRWIARVGGVWIPFRDPIFVAGGAALPDLPRGSEWRATGLSKVEREEVSPAREEIVGEEWATESPGADWTDTADIRTNSRDEYRWVSEDPGGGWTRTGQVRPFTVEEAWDEDESMWSRTSPDGEWSATERTRFIKEACAAKPADAAPATNNSIAPVAVTGELPDVGGPSRNFGVLAALTIGAGGILMAASRRTRKS